MHSTNYFNTFIEIAEDCPTKTAEIPPEKVSDKTVANLHFEQIVTHPYRYTSDDVIFKTYAAKKQLAENSEAERAIFFSKGQPCMRCSPLTKRYGWGIHSNEEGKIALYPVESIEYQQFLANDGLKKVKAMRSKKG